MKKSAFSTRHEGIAAKGYSSGKAREMICPYEEVEFFIQEKYRITGLTPASGNTANIGSFPANDLEQLRAGDGPFARYGKDFCDEYWRNYPRGGGRGRYSTIEEFLRWRKSRRKGR
ncbi:MAG: type II restriction endonuclease [Candidatus Binataceae bacterium]